MRWKIGVFTPAEKAITKGFFSLSPSLFVPHPFPDVGEVAGVGGEEGGHVGVEEGAPVVLDGRGGERERGGQEPVEPGEGRRNGFEL